MREIPGVIASFRGMFTVHVYESENFFLYHGGTDDERMLENLRAFADSLAAAVP